MRARLRVLGAVATQINPAQAGRQDCHRERSKSEVSRSSPRAKTSGEGYDRTAALALFAMAAFKAASHDRRMISRTPQSTTPILNASYKIRTRTACSGSTVSFVCSTMMMSCQFFAYDRYCDGRTDRVGRRVETSSHFEPSSTRLDSESNIFASVVFDLYVKGTSPLRAPTAIESDDAAAAAIVP